MFGVEVWIIHQEKDGVRYFYQGTENRGRRVWTRKSEKAFPFAEKEDAINVWENDLNYTGAIILSYL